MDMKAFGEKLKIRRESLGLNQDELGEMMELKKATISRYENGSILTLDTETAERFAESLNIDVISLLGWAKEKATFKPIPLLGTIAAGTPILAEENVERYYNIPIEWDIDFVLRVKGDSMIDAGIPNGSYVGVKSQNTAEDGQIAVCLIDGEEATLKRIKHYGKVLVLHPENKNLDDLLLEGKDKNRVKIQGIAKKLIKDL